MRMIYNAYSKAVNHDEEVVESVEDIMIENPITIHPEASIMEAMEIMDTQKIGCLPVVKSNQLVGIITEQNYMKIVARLLKVLHLNNDSDGQIADD